MSSRGGIAPLVLALALLAGCSGDDAEPDTSDTAAPTTEAADDTTDTTLPPSAIVDVSVPPGSDADAVGAREDVTDEVCEAGDDGWVASGNVTNPTDDVADYRIYVSLVGDGGDTAALVESGATSVAAGESSAWSVTITEVGDGPFDCVLRVERSAP